MTAIEDPRRSMQCEACKIWFTPIEFPRHLHVHPPSFPADHKEQKARLEEMVRAVVSGNLEFLGQAVFEGALGPVASLESVAMHQAKKLLAAIDAQGGRDE